MIIKSSICNVYSRSNISIAYLPPPYMGCWGEQKGKVR